MTRHSLMERVLMRLALMTFVTMAAIGVVLVLQLHAATDERPDRGLERMLGEVGHHLALGREGSLTLLMPPEKQAEFNENRFFTITNRHGEAYLSVPPGIEHAYHPFEPEQTEQPQYFEHRYTESSETYFGVTQHFMIGGLDIWIQVVEDVPFWRTIAFNSLEMFLQGVGVIVIIHLIVSAVMLYRTVQTSFAPVATAAAEARRVTPGEHDVRITTDSLPDEVVPLADAVNAALDRQEAALAAQKRFTADAAHELMTPLAILRAQAETADDKELSRALLDEIDEMTSMATQLLELAELDADSGAPKEICDLHEIAADVVGRLAPRALQAGIEPRLSGEGPVLVRGSAKSLRSAIENLVRNAIQHAHGASFVEVSVGPGGRVSVTDDGPGVPAALRPRVFDRFVRGDHSQSESRGLGLSIVKRVLDAHRGAVRVEDGPGGRGASFVLDLPDAEPA